MPRLIFKFAGGPLDGKTVEGAPHDEGEAREYYTLSHHGRLGQRFKIASDYAVNILVEEQLKEEQPHRFQQHVYEVVERIHNPHVLVVRAEYVKDIQGGDREASRNAQR
jgi:hypothetical protein